MHGAADNDSVVGAVHLSLLPARQKAVAEQSGGIFAHHPILPIGPETRQLPRPEPGVHARYGVLSRHGAGTQQYDHVASRKCQGRSPWFATKEDTSARSDSREQSLQFI